MKNKPAAVAIAGLIIQIASMYTANFVVGHYDLLTSAGFVLGLLMVCTYIAMISKK